MNQMTHRERIVATLAGGEVDRPAISLWRHFGGIDMTSEGLADAMIGFQAAFDFDFVKFMPTGTYTIIDWGAETAWEPNDTGIRTVKRLPVRAPEDWARLTDLDTSADVLGMVNDALSATVRAIGRDTPVLQTIFSPLSTARKLGGSATLAHMRQDPEAFAIGLATIERVTARLVSDAIERGADIFYAVQSGSADILSQKEFETLERGPADRLLGSLPTDSIVVMTMRRAMIAPPGPFVGVVAAHAVSPPVARRAGHDSTALRAAMTRWTAASVGITQPGPITRPVARSRASCTRSVASAVVPPRRSVQASIPPTNALAVR